MVDRDLLDRHGLRYDPEYPESEDYDLWSRLLAVARGDNLLEPLLLKARPPGSGEPAPAAISSARSSVAWRCVRSAPSRPGCPSDGAELAWRVGAGEPARRSRPRRGRRLPAARARFERMHGRRAERPCRGSALARAVAARSGRRSPSIRSRRFTVGAGRARRRAAGLELPTARPAARALAGHPEPNRARRPRHRRLARADAVPVAALRPDRARARMSISRSSTQAGPSPVEPGRSSLATAPSTSAASRVPLAARLVHHDYPVTPGHRRERCGDAAPGRRRRLGLEHVRSPGCARLVPPRRVPYVLLVVSHDAGRAPAGGAR